MFGSIFGEPDTRGDELESPRQWSIKFLLYTFGMLSLRGVNILDAEMSVQGSHK